MPGLIHVQLTPFQPGALQVVTSHSSINGQPVTTRLGAITALSLLPRPISQAAVVITAEYTKHYSQALRAPFPLKASAVGIPFAFLLSMKLSIDRIMEHKPSFRYSEYLAIGLR